MLFTPKKIEYFEGEKIIFPYRCKKNVFAYSNEEAYWSKDIWYIILYDQWYSIYYILWLLNSNLFYFWLYNKWKRKWDTLEMYAKPISDIPIQKASSEQQQVIEDKVKIIIEHMWNWNNNHSNVRINQDELLTDLNKLIYNLYGITDDEIKIIEDTLIINNKSLNEW